MRHNCSTRPREPLWHHHHHERGPPHPDAAHLDAARARLEECAIRERRRLRRRQRDARRRRQQRRRPLPTAAVAAASAAASAAADALRLRRLAETHPGPAAQPRPQHHPHGVERLGDALRVYLWRGKSVRSTAPAIGRRSGAGGGAGGRRVRPARRDAVAAREAGAQPGGGGLGARGGAPARLCALRMQAAAAAARPNPGEPRAAGGGAHLERRGLEAYELGRRPDGVEDRGRAANLPGLTITARHRATAARECGAPRAQNCATSAWR